MTPFEIDITRLDGRKILKVKKGFSLFLSKVQVFDENDKIVGIFKQKLFPIGNNFDMLDKNETLVCKLKGNLIGWNFKFLQNNNEIGLVTKKWSGIGKKCLQVQTIIYLEIKDKV